jgi:hypothetical protein
VGYQLLNFNSSERGVSHRPENQWDLKENRSRQPRGREREFPEAELDGIENVPETGGIEYRAADWIQISIEADIDGVSERTIRRRMQERGYHYCMACQKILFTWKTFYAQQEFYSSFIQYTIDQWKRIRFSDESHFGLGPKRKLQIIRRVGERNRCDCI